MKKKVSLLISCVLLLSTMLVGCVKDKKVSAAVENAEIESYTIEGIKSKGKLVVGTSADYPPFETHALKEGVDQIVGFDIELAKYIAKELGVELEIKDMDFDKLLGGLSAGMLDIVIAAMNPDPNRLEEANFTDIYYESKHLVIIHKDNAANFNSIDDLEGKVVGVQLGTTQEKFAKTLDGVDILSLSSNPDLVMNLKSKKIDCAIMEEFVAKSFAKTNEDLMVIESISINSGSEGLAIAVKKGNYELTDRLNEIILDAKAKGLIEKWLIETYELYGD